MGQIYCDNQVLSKLIVEQRDMVIYILNGVMAIYKTDNDPGFTHNQTVTLQDIESANPVKAIRYHKDNIPVEAKVDLDFVAPKRHQVN